MSRQTYLCNRACKGSPFVPGVVYVVSPGPRDCLTSFRRKGTESTLHYPKQWADELIRREVMIIYKFN